MSLACATSTLDRRMFTQAANLKCEPVLPEPNETDQRTMKASNISWARNAEVPRALNSSDNDISLAA